MAGGLAQISGPAGPPEACDHHPMAATTRPGDTTHQTREGTALGVFDTAWARPKTAAVPLPRPLGWFERE
jgi:hypothetical protein